MKYEEYLQRKSFSKEELVAFGFGNLVEDAPTEDFATLPVPPFLMVDRITEITHNGLKGRMVGEKDIRFDEWYFQCHFRSDPVQPGCLGVDAIWQLLGFYCAVRGALGTGRALGCKDVEFFGQIRPFNKLVTYEIDVRRFMRLDESKSTLVIGNGRVLVDGEPIYTVQEAKVGVFQDIRYTDYPKQSKNSRGGVMAK